MGESFCTTRYPLPRYLQISLVSSAYGATSNIFNICKQAPITVCGECVDYNPHKTAETTPPHSTTDKCQWLEESSLLSLPPYTCANLKEGSTGYYTPLPPKGFLRFEPWFKGVGNVEQ